jgi:hypothetical protein
MTINFGKFLNSQTGRHMMSVIIGLGLASLFRAICKGKNCVIINAPPLETFKDKIHKNTSNKCVKFNPIVTKCTSTKKIIEFE